MSDERRRFTRIEFDAESNIIIKGTPYPVSMLDLCLKGVLFEADTPLPIAMGDECLLTMCLFHTDIVLEFNSRLVHQHGKAMGFEFLSESLETFTHLRRIIELNVGDEKIVHLELSELWNR